MPKYTDIVPCGCQSLSQSLSYGQSQGQGQGQGRGREHGLGKLFDHPASTAVVLTLFNSYLNTEADRSVSSGRKWFFYTIAGLVNLYIIKV